MKRKALGRGLNALIPDLETDSEKKSAPGLRELPLEEIQPGRFQPRKQFDDGPLEELTASILENGVVQPIVVQKAGKGRYEIICGERRWRAAQKAGLRKIPVLIHAGAAGKQLQIALIENLHRQDLNPIEEAQAYQRLIMEFNLTQEAVAKQVGKKRASVANFIRLLKLPRKVQEDLRSGVVTFGHARALLGLHSEKDQEVLRRAIVLRGLSVREAEAWVQRKEQKETPAGQPAPGPERKDVFIHELERKLGRRLGTKVDIKPGKKGGRLVVSYYSHDDLSRILDILLK